MARARGVAAGVLIFAGLAGLAARAEAADGARKPAPEACFSVRDVNGFSAPDERTVYLRVGLREVYRLDLMTDCLELTFRDAIGLESRPGGPWICSPLEAEIVYRDHALDARCPVSAITRLTPDQIEALPRRDRP